MLEKSSIWYRVNLAERLGNTFTRQFRPLIKNLILFLMDLIILILLPHWHLILKILFSFIIDIRTSINLDNIIYVMTSQDSSQVLKQIVRVRYLVMEPRPFQRALASLEGWASPVGWGSWCRRPGARGACRSSRPCSGSRPGWWDTAGWSTRLCRASSSPGRRRWRDAHLWKQTI